jgi:predicted HTH domain antitoxin
MAEAATLLDELDVLIEKGINKDRESLVGDAMRSLLRSQPELRGQLAVELYRQGRVSLSRAAEIGGTDMESFKELLREAGVARVIPPVGEAIENEVKQLLPRMILLPEGLLRIKACKSSPCKLS